MLLPCQQGVVSPAVKLSGTTVHAMMEEDEEIGDDVELKAVLASAEKATNLDNAAKRQKRAVARSNEMAENEPDIQEEDPTAAPLAAKTTTWRTSI